MQYTILTTLKSDCSNINLSDTQPDRSNIISHSDSTHPVSHTILKTHYARFTRNSCSRSTYPSCCWQTRFESQYTSRETPQKVQQVYCCEETKKCVKFVTDKYNDEEEDAWKEDKPKKWNRKQFERGVSGCRSGLSEKDSKCQMRRLLKKPAQRG